MLGVKKIMDSVYHNSVNGECDGNSKYQVGLDKETTPLAMDNTRSSDLPTNTAVEDATENFRNSQQDTKLAEVLPTGTTDEDVDDSSLPPKITIEDTTTPLVYRIKDNPPIYLTIVFAIQQALLSFATQLIISLLVAQAVHGEDNAEFRGHLLGSTMFMCGFSTMAMSLFGSRLPIFQGGSAEYIIPLLVLQDGGQKHKCDVTDLPGTTGNYSENPLFYSNNTLYNFTSNTTTIMGGDLLQDNQYVDYVKLRGMMGSLMIIGCIHTFVGVSGLIGVLLRFVGPITVVPTLLLVGLWVARITANMISVHWGIGAMTSAISVILSLCLGHLKMPLPFWSKTRGCHIIRSNFHQTTGILIALLSGWLLCAVVTETGGFSDNPKEPDYFARTDIVPGVIQNASWIYFPYPGQFGTPLFSGEAFVGFLIATLINLMDSIADYYACAMACNVPPPPAHAVNRGIAVEGFCSFLSGTLGCGHATGSYGGNIGAIRITKVASRRVFLVLGFLYMLFGILGKFCALFITIPRPVLGGTMLIMVSMFIGVVIANLHHVDLRSNRNLAIMGMAIAVGSIVPHWIEENPDRLKTGNEALDQIISMLFGNAAIAGTVLACILDNTIVGTAAERGLLSWTEGASSGSDDKNDVTSKQEKEYSEGLEVYEPIVPRCMRGWKGFRYIPIMPNTFAYQQNELDKKESI